MSIESERIKQLRAELGLGVREMAREIQVNPATICYWEKGTRMPNVIALHKLINLSARYGKHITMEWLRPVNNC